MNIPYDIRALLSEKSALSVLKAILLDQEMLGDKIKVPLSLLESSISEYFKEYYSLHSDTPVRIPKSVFDTPDYQLIEELTKNKVISSDIGPDENESWFALTKIINKPLLKKCYQWVRDILSGDVLNYGVFSLNLNTGEAYCLDNSTRLTPSRGLFHLLKAFMKNPKHELTLQEIIYYRSSDVYESPASVSLIRNKHLVYENIKDVKERLRMKGKLTKLIVSTGKGYKLLEGNTLF
ncbi:MAG: hypothetical protein UW22_C0002G0005 [Candidatus Gottesmanbacteria bacterium GW2011_GWB1_44_11c]|uniref:Uncharacterized protein n=2 Tax=Candidatus Gottesmaniibacteriota TaxID=1752720 RepID=A0A0G1IQ37_9BACT|nr:MAG: hypothetical protein UW22_C0002G0005 [Candidatus Gottesmanbacteria bacterium GW2011_GWB1_44_11c]KKT61491.1 MAG: hypothetical protein UW52_C0002G0005 [Candidatus Gottesmanbacteria bacterium GW2011_GWA1_44_24b]